MKNIIFLVLNDVTFFYKISLLKRMWRHDHEGSNGNLDHTVCPKKMKSSTIKKKYSDNMNKCTM